jgi:DNA-binding NtrC family response regulator
MEAFMPRQRRILIIDPDESHLATWRTELGDKFHVTNASSIPDAEEIIMENPEFAAIAVESFLDGNTIQSLSFIERLRHTFRKPIIGIATKYEHQQQMILAGCNIYAIRLDLPNKIYEALKIYAPIKKAKKPKKIKKSFLEAQRKKMNQAT